MRLALGNPGQAHHLQGFLGALPRFFFAQAFHLQAEHDVLFDRQMGEERVVLKYGVDWTMVSRDAFHGAATDQDAPGRRLLEPGDQAQGRGFAAAAGSEQGEKLAVGDLHANLVDRAHDRSAGLELLDDIAQLDVGCRHVRDLFGRRTFDRFSRLRRAGAYCPRKISISSQALLMSSSASAPTSMMAKRFATCSGVGKIAGSLRISSSMKPDSIEA